MRSPWHSLSLRWRLTVFYVGLLSALLLVLGILLDAQLSGFLIDSTAAHLVAQANPIVARQLDKPLPKEPEKANESPGKGRLMRVAKDVARDLTSKDSVALVLDLQGNVIGQEQVLPEQPALSAPDLAALRRAIAGEETRRVLDMPNGRLLVVMMPLRYHGEIIGVLQISAPLDQADAVLAFERLLLAFDIVTAILVGTLAGIVVTGAALAPLERVVEVSRRIATGDLSQRVHLSPRGDEIGQLATTFDDMMARLEAVFKLQRQFVADASHELRTPLTALSGALDVLLISPEGDRQATRRLLRGMRREAQRLIRLVNDLLLLVRLDAHVPLQRAQVDLCALAREIVEELRPLAGERQMICAADEPVTVTADLDQLKRVLLNLMENAIHATMATVGQITLGINAQDGAAHIHVIDNGEGIAPEALPHVFERFYRTDRARARSSGGSGLGLSIVQEIVNAHHGRIQVKSEPGRNTIFSVTLPLNMDGAR
ncbi:MAG: HAMP domain-containing protein [Chloroflexi bacterium]|nr:HAMP domain-containing protein [Chloroflexota bacterium]